MKYRLLIMFFVTFSLILSGCGSKTQNQQSNQNTGLNVGIDTNPTTEIQQKTAEIQIIAKKWEFSPSTITVKKGQKVKLSINSIDVDHGIAIPEFDISDTLAEGKTTIIEFTPDKTGTFTFFCNVFCGRGHKDMKGTLIVQ